MDPITIAMIGLTGVLFLFAVGFCVFLAGCWLYDVVRGLIGIRMLCAKEDKTLDTVARVRARGHA